MYALADSAFFSDLSAMKRRSVQNCVSLFSGIS